MPDMQKAIITRTVELLRDPDRVVLDPCNLYETASGVATYAGGEMPPRGCVIGCVRIATVELGGDLRDDHGAVSALRDAFGGDAFVDAYGTLTAALENYGGPLCADIIERELLSA